MEGVIFLACMGGLAAIFIGVFSVLAYGDRRHSDGFYEGSREWQQDAVDRGLAEWVIEGNRGEVECRFSWVEDDDDADKLPPPPSSDY